ncbi:MAG: annexin [Candidatus Gastranaerophilales bacterium]|nr:annexin [Candidatus Gastranaerophilales bacterium]
MALINNNCVNDGGTGSGLIPQKPLEIEVYGADTQAIINDIVSGTYSDTTQVSNALGTLAAYGQIDELNTQLEEAGIDLVEMYGGEDTDAGLLVKTMLDTSDDEQIEDFDAQDLADSLFEAMDGLAYTDEAQLIQILGNASYSPEQIQEICDAYKTKYGSELSSVISGDTSGQFNTLLNARLLGANDYIEDTIRDDIEFNRDNPNNVQAGDAETTTASASFGEVEITKIYNANGDVIGQVAVNYDFGGNIISKTTSNYAYDENGNLREQVDVLSDKNGNELSTTVNRLDENQNIVQQYMRYQNEDGTVQERSTEYLYNDKANPNLTTCMRETDVLFDQNGNVIYKTEKNDDVMQSLKDDYSNYIVSENDYIEISKCKTPQELVNFLNEKIDNGTKIDLNEYTQNWQKEFDEQAFKITEMSDEAVALVSEEILAKIDLMAEDKTLWANFVEGWTQMGLTAEDWNEHERSKFRDKLQDAVNDGKFDTINSLYNEINAKLYPEGSQGSLIDNIRSMYSAQDYYDSLNPAEVSQQMSIRQDFDPISMKPETYGEMLLCQLQEVKNQFELYKDNMGFLDTSISFMNRLFDVGTSEDDVEAIFAQYEKELKELSSLEGAEFCASFKALTGDEFSEGTLSEISMAAQMCADIENMSEEELLLQARGWANIGALNIENAYDPDPFKRDEYGNILYEINEEESTEDCIIYKHDEHGNMIPIRKTEEERIDYNKLKTVLKETYIEVTHGLDEKCNDPNGIVAGASNSSPGNALDDYKDTVEEQREFAIDLARTALVVAMAPSGAIGAGLGLSFWGAVGLSGFTGAAVEAIGHAFNSNAIGDQKAEPHEVVSDIVAGFTSSIFQAMGSDMAKGITNTKALKFMAEKFNVSTDVIKNVIEKVGLKGVSSNVIKSLVKDSCEYLFNPNLTQEEKDNYIHEMIENAKNAADKGAIIGILLIASDFLGTKTKGWASETLNNGRDDGWMDDVAKIIKSTYDSTARTVGGYLADGEYDPAKITQTTWKEFAKNYLKAPK